MVKDGEIISEGCHYQAGAAHAEVAALSPLNGEAQGASLYVTLEPCCHYGKTPPCVDLVIKHKLEAVYFALKDPNTKVCGQGQAKLKQAGIVCEHIPIKAIDDFYKSYLYWTEYQRPWVTMKVAMSQDGKIAGLNGQTVQLTGVECQQYTHQHRLKSDAILTTVNTVRTDNPQLNVRLDGATYAKSLYVLDSELNMPRDAVIFKSVASVTLFHSNQANLENIKYFESQGVACVLVDKDQAGLDLLDVLARVGQDGVHDLWVEAGARCFNSFYHQRLLQRFLLYVSKKRLGSEGLGLLTRGLVGNGQAMQLAVQQLGNDVVFDFTETELINN